MIGDTLDRAQTLMQQLLVQHHLTHQEIANRLGGRVSARTLYRWAKGEHAPQQPSDLTALELLVQQLGGSGMVTADNAP
jgi:hypothetical protein